MADFLLPLLAVCIGTIVFLAVRDRRERERVSVTYTPPSYTGTISVTHLMMDWDAVEWWDYGVLWDDYEPREE